MSIFGLTIQVSSCKTMADRCCWFPEDSTHGSQEPVRSIVLVESLLTLVCVGLMLLLHAVPGCKMAILNLFFLPVALAGFVLGRYRAGALAMFCAIGTSLMASLNLADLTLAISIPVVVSSIAIWGAVLGLSAILIGSIGDDRRRALGELHEAYVGVVEVLSRYLQGANPRLKERSARMAELAQQVAARMRLSVGEVDDIRVASLLYDIGHVEITTKVMRRAIDTLEGETASSQPSTFRGLDLMLSLGSVLRGAIPLLLCQNQGGSLAMTADAASVKIPLGAEIIRATRAYCNLVNSDIDKPNPSPAEAIHSLRNCGAITYDSHVLDVLESIEGR
jgi:hypothetical protein